MMWRPNWKRKAWIISFLALYDTMARVRTAATVIARTQQVRCRKGAGPKPKSEPGVSKDIKSQHIHGKFVTRMRWLGRGSLVILAVLHGIDDDGVHDHGGTVEAMGGVDLGSGYGRESVGL